MKRFLITASGEDKPGIVKAVSEVLYRHGFNIEDSSMTRLGDEFTIMLIVETDDITKKEDLERELNQIASLLGLSITVKRLPKEIKQEKAQSKKIINIVVYGADKPGIVFNVAKLLADKSINISDLRTEKTKDLYVMIIEAEVPESVEILDLENNLEKLKEKLNVDISMKNIETVQM